MVGYCNTLHENHGLQIAGCCSEVWDRFELSNKSFADFPLKPLGYHTKFNIKFRTLNVQSFQIIKAECENNIYERT